MPYLRPVELNLEDLRSLAIPSGNEDFEGSSENRGGEEDAMSSLNCLRLNRRVSTHDIHQVLLLT